MPTVKAILRNNPINSTVMNFEGTLPPPHFEMKGIDPATNKPCNLCRYTRIDDENGIAVFELQEYIDLKSDEDKAMEAANQFYLKPDYNIYTLKPGLHKEIVIEIGHRRGSVDEVIAEIIKAVWLRGWDTLGSCQERPDGEHKGMAYISFPVFRHGREFIAELTKGGIKHRIWEHDFTVKRNNSITGRTETFSLPSMNVYFDARDKASILVAIAIHSEPDS